MTAREYAHEVTVLDCDPSGDRHFYAKHCPYCGIAACSLFESVSLVREWDGAEIRVWHTECLDRDPSTDWWGLWWGQW